MTGIALVESTALDTSRIDRQAGIARDVRVLGAKSRNGRTYTAGAMRDLVRLGENAVVYLDHPSQEHAGTHGPRQLRERFGVLRGLYESNGGVSARELRFDPSHPYAGSFTWNALNAPRKFGLSINAFSRRFRREKGAVIIEGVDTLHSVDLVCDPATTISLFEQQSLLDVVMPQRAARPAPRPIDLIRDELVEQIHGDDTESVADRARGKYIAARLWPDAKRPAAVGRIKANLLRQLGR